MISDSLNTYKIIFLIELSIAIFFFCFRLKRRKHFLFRLFLGLAVVISITLLLPYVSFNDWVAESLYSSSLFLLIFLGCIFCVWLCFNENISTILFTCLAAYLTQHMAYSLFNAVQNLAGFISPGQGMYGGVGTNINVDILFQSIVYYCCYLPAYVSVFFWFANRIETGTTIVIKNISLVIVSSILFLVALVLNSLIVYLSYTVGPDEFSKFRLIVGFSSLISFALCFISLQFEFVSFEAKQYADNYDLAKALLHQEEVQYKQAQANIDLINVKCHDMKHQILRLESSGNIDSAFIKELANAINIYDVSLKTGNRALDTILASKSLQCVNSGIKVTCLLDGKCLSFMDETDIYSLFGNLLDNSIEAVSKVEKEGRYISINSSKRGNILFIQIKNPYVGSIKMKNGLPITSKGDSSNHGFGLRSIRNTVSKYHGNTEIEIKQNIFRIGILFPL